MDGKTQKKNIQKNLNKEIEYKNINKGKEKDINEGQAHALIKLDELLKSYKEKKDENKSVDDDNKNKKKEKKKEKENKENKENIENKENKENKENIIGPIQLPPINKKTYALKKENNKIKINSLDSNKSQNQKKIGLNEIKNRIMRGNNNNIQENNIRYKNIFKNNSSGAIINVNDNNLKNNSKKNENK